MPVSGQRMLRPLVSDLESAAESYDGDPLAETEGPAGKYTGQMPFLLFAKGVEVEIAFAFSTLESKQRL